MKKLILITSCVALFAVTTYAQTDTTKSKTQTQPQPTTQQSDELRKDQDMKGWTKVQSSEVPANLRTTLNGTEYSGWETGTVYRNEAGDSYQLRTSGNTPKTYYFDKNGKATKRNGTNPH
ncbi:MAG: hypothetical protein WDO14_06685 [Bacteroidota bacterium]